MARDIEEFLRRAAERRKQQATEASPQPVGRPKSSNPPATTRKPPRSAAAMPIDDAVIVEDVEVAEQRIQPSLKSSIDTSKIAAHAEALGRKVANTEQHIHQHLDHNVGKIGDTEAVTDDPSPAIVGGPNQSAAKELRKLLANPKSVGQAIILAEILKRPEF